MGARGVFFILSSRSAIPFSCKITEIPLPEPDDENNDNDSGRFNVRMPRTLHRDLVRAAEAEGVSLNLFVATALAHAVSHVSDRPKHDAK